MKKEKILNTLNEYKKYKRFENISDCDKEHIKKISYFIYDNLDGITNCTWFDMAGGFMMFAIEINGSTYCIYNESDLNEDNTTIYHNLSLKAYIELEKISYDMDLLLQEHTTI
jgi:hypothetical protein